MRKNESVLLYMIYKNIHNNEEYAISGRFKKNLDKYYSWYGCLSKAPSDIVITGYAISVNHKDGSIEVDTSSAFSLKVKDLKDRCVSIVR